MSLRHALIATLLMLLSASMAATQPATQPVVNVLDTATLNALDEGGFSFAEQIGARKAASTRALYDASPAYRSLSDTIGKPLPHDPRTDQLPQMVPAGAGDIPDMVRLLRNFEDKGRRSANDSKGGYFIRHLSNNSQYPYTIENDGDEPRHFDTRWLQSPHAQLRLIAIVNRMDRADFDRASCGEVRFIYRLSYRTAQSASSLPFFLNVVKTYPKLPDCAAFARRWQPSGASTLSADALKSSALRDLTLKQIELNFQSLRFTSGYMHDFGGQAMYMQRIFKPVGEILKPVRLENTPDVQAIQRAPRMLERFTQFLKTGDNLKKLDNGTLLVNFDEAFLTQFAVSWSTLGRARTANKPYARLFAGRKDLLDTISLNGLKHIKSRDALVERLDNMTCMGCHQSGGTAGFHMLGRAEDSFSHHFNRQQLPLSPHAYAEIARRQDYVARVASQVPPNTFRPHSGFTEASWSGPEAAPRFKPATLGHLCTSEQHFAGAPTCGAINGQPTSCVQTVTAAAGNVVFGECTVSGGRIFAGAVCWKGEVSEVQTMPTDRGAIPSFNLYAFQDKWKLKGSAYRGGEVGNLRCVLPQSGAPLGRASRKCTMSEENLDGINPAQAMPAHLCANQGGNGFDLCAASGNAGACLESRVVRGMLDTCSPSKACREDYICQKLPDYNRISAAHYGNTRNGSRVNLSSPDRISGTTLAALHDREVGFCVPTYFLFNMRLDGHPSPVTGKPPGSPRIDRSQPVRGYPR
jgi:hypothetical protein